MLQGDYSTVVLVFKKGHPIALTDFKPIVLKSHIKETFETLVLQFIVRDSLDPVCLRGKHWC